MSVLTCRFRPLNKVIPQHKLDLNFNNTVITLVKSPTLVSLVKKDDESQYFSSEEPRVRMQRQIVGNEACCHNLIEPKSQGMISFLCLPHRVDIHRVWAAHIVAGSPGAPGPHAVTPGALEPLPGATGTPQPAAPAARATGGGAPRATISDRLYRRHSGWKGLEVGGMVGVLARGLEVELG